MAPVDRLGGPIVKNKSIPITCASLVAAAALGLLSKVSARAADLPYLYQPVPTTESNWTFKGLDAPSSYVGEFGLRFWFGDGKTGKSLYDPTGTSLVSRLTYNGQLIFGGEAFTRFDFNNGWFLKGYAGGVGLFDGKLRGEDFPPAIN